MTVALKVSSNFFDHIRLVLIKSQVAKERLTFMVTMNYSGSEKSKLLVIGKSAKPSFLFNWL